MSFPLRFNTAKRCAELGLRPIVGRTEGNNFIPAVKYAAGLPSDHPKFAAHMIQEHADCDRLGLIMGECRAGNVFALDVDRGHAEGVDGYRELRAWLDEQELAALPRGPRWVTPRGGLQMLFRAPEGVRIRSMSGSGALAPGVDVRGRNGLVTIPPTVRHDGEYRWCGSLSVFEIAIPLAPTALLDAVRYAERQAPEQIELEAVIVDRVTSDWEAERRAAYLESALDGIVRSVVQAPKGGRNHALLNAAREVARWSKGDGRTLFREEVMISRLVEAATANGLVGEDGLQSVNATIRSGLQFGRQSAEARKIPPPRYAPKHDGSRGETRAV